MKKALLIVCAVICSVFYVEAQQYQDVVYLKNGSIVRGVIMEQSPGQSLKIQTADGSQFVYQMTEVKKMTKELTPVQQLRTIASVKASRVKKTIDWTPKYKGDINIGYAVAGRVFDCIHSYEYSDGSTEEYESSDNSSDLSRLLFETVHGVEIGPYFFVGAGLGLQYYYGKTKTVRGLAITKKSYDKAERWNGVMLPIFANVKFMYPVNNHFTPFINLSIGGSIGCYSSFNSSDTVTEEDYYEVHEYNYTMKARGGFYCDFGAGFRYKSLNFGLGLQHQVLKLVKTCHSASDSYKKTWKHPSNAFYLKVGLNF